MDSLTSLAFDSYIENGIAGAVKLSVPPHVIAARLGSLRQLAPADRESELVWLYQWLYGRPYEQWADPWWRFEELEEEWLDDDEWLPGMEFEVGAAEQEFVTAEAGSGERAGTSNPPELPTPTILEFRTESRQHGLIRIWDFHKGDSDPYPSVPHGHEVQGNRAQAWPKLDPYRGFVYDESGAQLKREPRRAILALWNNPSFRTFAHEALAHALATEKSLERRIYDERGIRHPLLLPGERGRRGL